MRHNSGHGCEALPERLSEEKTGRGQETSQLERTKENMKISARKTGGGFMKT